MSGDKPQAAVLRIKLRHKSIDSFIEKFAENVSHGGIFISTKQLKSVGTEIRFEIQLADGSPAIKGEGRVAFVKEHDPDEPQGAFGMGIKLTKLAGKSREVLKKCLDWKSTHKKSELESATDKIPIHTGQFELPEGGPAKEDTSGPVQDPPARPAQEDAGRPQAQEDAGPPLELPELDELAAEAGLDEAKLVAALEHLKGQAANGTVDADLDELLKRDPTSAVSVDDATAELARMLGGSPVARRAKIKHPLAEAHQMEDDEASALTPPPVNVPLPDLDVSLYREEERPAVAVTPAPANAGHTLPAKEIGAEVASVLDALEHEIDGPSDTKVDTQAPMFVGRGVVDGDPSLYDDVPDTVVRTEKDVTPPPAETPDKKGKTGFFKKLFGK
jgi:uncharacterized protein (TIGR02266 family)